MTFFVLFSVNGVWGPWSMWSACTTSCGPGTRERKRSCNSPPPQFGGKPCSGSERQVGDCSYRPCPGKEYVSLGTGPVLANPPN